MADPSIKRVLDVGCNHGSVEAMFHKQHPDAVASTQIEGIDIASEAVEQAKELELTNCKFQSYDGNTIPFPDDTFDLVVLVEVIEHVVDKPALFHEIGRVLKPFGKLFVTTPNPQCWPLRLESLMSRTVRWAFRKDAHEKDEFVSHDELEAILKDAGFVSTREGSMYAHPRLYLQLFGWCLIPPMPSRLQYRYHKYSLTEVSKWKLPRFLEKHFNWTLIGEMQKIARER
jgi:2-polyprenyl-3-methyl-5-hydroxy-6-metoxy-1,4-benzoquinol methylase